MAYGALARAGRPARAQSVSNPNVIAFPSFTADEYRPYEMRQLVSAVELRLQGLEGDVETTSSASSATVSDFDTR